MISLFVCCILFICTQFFKISKVAYANGMVVSTCKHCRNLHLIADNEGKMDMKQYGKKIEDYLREKSLFQLMVDFLYAIVWIYYILFLFVFSQRRWKFEQLAKERLASLLA